MENEMIQEGMENIAEVVEDVVDVEGNNTLRNVGIGLGVAAVSGLAYKFVLKPGVTKVKGFIQKQKDKKNESKVDPEFVDNYEDHV